MPGSPANRLEPHWPRMTAPEGMSPTEEMTWSEMAKSWEEELENVMADHPKLTLLAAATIGLLLGWVVKRR